MKTTTFPIADPELRQVPVKNDITVTNAPYECVQINYRDPLSISHALWSPNFNILSH